MSPWRFIRALALSCHPLPTMAVTAISAALAALAGLPVGRGALLTVTVFTGQLSIGWSNDYLDAGRDAAVARPDKPIARGDLAPRVVGIASLMAFASTLTLSAFLGWPGGAVALVTVVSAWAYNLGLKATALSWLPYGVSFGLAPAVATLSADPPRWPATWVMVAFALLGIAAHLANVLPDLRDDLAHGIRGLAHRIGARATALTAAAILLAASVVVLLGPAGRPGAWSWAGFAATVVFTVAATRFAYADASSRRFFVSIIAIAGICLASVGVAGIRF